MKLLVMLFSPFFCYYL